MGCLTLLTATGIALWLWLAPTASLISQQVRFSLRAGIASNGGYGLCNLVAGLLLRRTRTRMLGLLIAAIVGIAFPALLALNVYLEWGRMPAWQAIIPMWLGMPFSAWTVLVLFCHDVRDAHGRVS